MIEELHAHSLRARVSSKWGTFAPDVIPSNPAEMDFGTAPAIQGAMQRMVDLQQYGYTPRSEGNPKQRLISSFARRMRCKFRWDADPSGVVVLNDLVQAVMATVVAFAEPDQGVVLQVPSYPAFLRVLDESGRRAVLNPMIDLAERFELNIDHFCNVTASGVKIILLCHPHNPTGRVFSVEELAPIAEIAVERDLVVVSDEIHADLMFDGTQHVPFAKMFPEAADRTVTLYSATKSYNIPGLRCAIMHFGSEDLQARFGARVPAALLGTPSIAGVLATLAAWEGGSTWSDALVRFLEANRDRLISRFAAELPKIRIHKPEATYLAWADLTAFGLKTVPFEHLLDHARVGGGDGRRFGPGFENCVRLNFATSPSILDEKIDRIVRGLRANQPA